MTPTFSLVLNHTPWIEERVLVKAGMLADLLPLSRGVPFLLHDTDYRRKGELDRAVPGNPKPEWVDFSLAQWRWSLEQNVTHHLFLTDDLRLAPNFWDLLSRMVIARPQHIIGLLSNHPRGPALYADGLDWYRTNSWVVGPGYVLEHELLKRFFPWANTYRGERAGMGWADDSLLNEWNTFHGPGETWHPLPTIIEHETISTWAHTGHGDAFSHERVSWRQVGASPELLAGMTWSRVDRAPMLTVGG